MSYTKITNADLKSRGATTLPNQPAISAQELKEEFDAPAKQIVAYAFNRLIDELEAATAAGSMGATAPQGFVGTTVQALLDAIGSAVKSLQASQVGATAPSGQTGDNVQGVIDSIGGDISSINEDITSLKASAHTHSNKALLDAYAQTETDLADAVSKKHSHSNKSTLDKLSEDSSGNPTFDGHAIPTSGEVGGFQKFIDVDLLPPSGDGDEGDLQFYGSTPARLYRYENGEWVVKNWVAYGETNPDSSPVDGDIYVENDGSKITSIWQYVNGSWLVFSLDTGFGHLVHYSTTEQNTEVKYLDGSDIYQKSYYLTEALSLTSDTWTNAIQSNNIGEIIDAKGKNGNGDMIALIGRTNNGYAQVMNLMSASQSLKILTLQYIKAVGGYEFNADYQQGSTYTVSPTVDAEQFFIWLVKHFINVCKTKWASSPTYSYILTNLQTICSRFLQYKGNNNGIGVMCYLNTNYNSVYQAFGIFVAFTNGSKSATISTSATEHGDDSKYVYGNEGQSSLWATNGEYYFNLYYKKDGSDYYTEWKTPEWAYTMYCRYLGIKYSTDNSDYLSTENVTNYGITLT